MFRRTTLHQHPFHLITSSYINRCIACRPGIAAVIHLTAMKLDMLDVVAWNRHGFLNGQGHRW